MTMRKTLRVAGAIALTAAALAIGYRAFSDEPSTGTVTGCEHGIEACPFCQPQLIDELGFCGEHGVPEALCTRCRSSLEAVFRAEQDWCGGHDLPESQCELCNPGVLDQYAGIALATAPGAAAIPDVSVVRTDAPRASRPPTVTCTTERSVVRFATSEVAEHAGLRFASVQRAPLRETVEVPAQLAYDARRHARLAPRAPGIVSEVLVDLGDTVEADQPLVVVDSADLGAAKAMLLQADARTRLWERNAERERRLLESGLTTERDALHAETELVEGRILFDDATQRLRMLGLDEDAIDRVLHERDTSSRLPVLAPFEGAVVGLESVVGASARADAPLVEVADTSDMWAWLDVDPHDVRRVTVGHAVLLSVHGLEGQTVAGRVTWVSPQVDARTRTVKVRAELGNPDGQLRAGDFATARIVTRDGVDAVLVPKAAVQWDGCCNVAFIRRSATDFVPAKLLLGSDTGDAYEVLAGLEGEETVVTEGSFLLKTELQKGSIGAGCCEVDYLGR
jgi:cobalt-zinc-cadmium efflux system membrane fusion protein